MTGMDQACKRCSSGYARWYLQPPTTEVAHWAHPSGDFPVTYEKCGNQSFNNHGFRAVETLDLIAEGRLTVVPGVGGTWLALPAGTASILADFTIESDEWEARAGQGSTIGDAVRACCERMREEAQG